jgi:hypothetical protein
MSGRRPLIKGYFRAVRWSWVRSCLRPFDAETKVRSPPQTTPARFAHGGPRLLRPDVVRWSFAQITLTRSVGADSAAGFRINPLPAHHLLVTLDCYAALASSKPRPRTR